ncbi:hypothetical protein ABEF95_006576 [Exophiala dermatitidis]
MADITPINPTNLLHQLTDEFSAICSAILYPTHLFHETGLLPTGLFDNLVCLDTNEFRYLPLWMPEGLDDGTGGVFDECPVPNMDDSSESFEPAIKTSLENQDTGKGKARRRGDTNTNTISEDSFSDIASQAISTVGKASKVATDGTETVKSLSTTASVSVGGAGPANTENGTTATATAPNHHTLWHSGSTQWGGLTRLHHGSDSDGAGAGAGADTDSDSSDSDTQLGVSLNEVLDSSPYDLVDPGDAPSAAASAATTAIAATTAGITAAMATTSLNYQHANNDDGHDNHDEDYDFGDDDNDEGFDEIKDYDDDDDDDDNGTEGEDEA